MASKTDNLLKREDLYSLEDYAKIRDEFRTKVMEHKQNRRLEIGPNMTLFFEDRLIMQYQVQEMLRAERIFEADGIQDELDAYNPLVPDGNNWKATLMVQYADVEERKLMLSKLVGIEDKTWVQIGDFDKVYAIADEDLERDSEEKTSAVHFLRFDLTPEMIIAAHSGANISAGVDHENYRHTVSPVPDNVADSLRKDLVRPLH